MVTESQVLGATADMNAKGVDLPIKDGLEIGEPENLEKDMPGDITSDEESELPGTARPRKGAGWWGQGPALKATRKGIPREFVDGAGLCSPGRWPIDQRVLPDDYTSRRLRKALEEGLDRAMKEMRTRRKDDAFDMKRLLMESAIGRHEKSPFDEALVDEIGQTSGSSASRQVTAQAFRKKATSCNYSRSDSSRPCLGPSPTPTPTCAHGGQKEPGWGRRPGNFHEPQRYSTGS